MVGSKRDAGFGILAGGMQQTGGAQHRIRVSQAEEAAASATLIKRAAANLEIAESTEGGGGEEREPSVPIGKLQHFLSCVIPVKHGRQNHSEKEWGRGEENQLFFIFIDRLQ